MKKLIETVFAAQQANVEFAFISPMKAAAAVIPFYAVSYSLFWSVFGLAAQYNYRKPAYAYGLCP